MSIVTKFPTKTTLGLYFVGGQYLPSVSWTVRI